MKRSGQITVTTAGTAVRGTSEYGRTWALIAHPSNSGIVYVGNDGAGDVTAANGFALSETAPVVVTANNLNEFWFDASANAQIVCWLKLD